MNNQQAPSIGNRFSVRYLGSGSKGNSCLIQVGNTSVLIDAGVNPSDFPRDIIKTDINAILLSHNHGDHVKYVEILANRYRIPVYAAPDVIDLKKIPTELKRFTLDRDFIELGDLCFVCFNVMHDTEDSQAFLFINKLSNRTLAFIPECGTLLGINIPEFDFIAIEANYDNETINRNYQAGNINKDLYDRITGLFGHMEIYETLKFLSEHKYHAAILHNMSGGNLNRDIPLPPKTQFAEINKEYIL